MVGPVLGEARMVAKEAGPLKAFAVLCGRSLGRIGVALLLLVKNAARPTTERSHRVVALLLLASIAMLGLGAFVGTQLSTAATLTLCLLGAVGLLISGLAGSQLDATAHNSRPSSGDFPLLPR